MKQWARVVLACGMCGAVLLGGCATKGERSGLGAIDNPRLQQAMMKLRQGETISVVSIGGSITSGHQAAPPDSAGWSGLVNLWWQAKAKETGGKINCHNSGVSGTDSVFASIRVKDHALAYNPDVVFVEFAMNDQWLSARVRQRSYEGVLRQLLNDSERAVVLLAVNEKGDPGKSARADQEKIGDHYGLPTLAWADWVNPADWDRHFSGSETIHPNNEGHADIARGVIRYLDAAWNSLPSKILPIDTTLPEPLVSAEFQNVRLIGGNDVGYLASDIASSGWTAKKAILPDEWKKSGGGDIIGWTTNDPNADIAIKVTGKSVGVLFVESDQFRNGEAWLEEIDAWWSINSYVSYRNGYYGYAYAEIADNLEAGKEYTLHLYAEEDDEEREGASIDVIGVICTGY
ncbi:MAG: SGNH/GDSL hydrolase family protein [Treponema sp.]|jgi:lysophospholipase L1-like esterase|nr:SGNH/GDSL hydrolase family protein [Treponema sp.]